MSLLKELDSCHMLVRFNLFTSFHYDFQFQLELQFEDQNMQFTVAPIHAVIITKFQDQTR